MMSGETTYFDLVPEDITNYLYNFIYGGITNDIKDGLKEIFGEHYKTFTEIIRGQGVISGSFILKKIDKTANWDSKDIDIFMPGNRSQVLENFFINDLNFTMYGGPTRYHPDCRWVSKASVYKFTKGKIYIDVIYLHQKYGTFKDSCNFIRENFDFNICKNMFYYYPIGQSFPDSKRYNENLEITDYNAILNKEIKIELPEKRLDPNRIKKYAKRGYTFVESNNDSLIKVINEGKHRDLKQALTKKRDTSRTISTTDWVIKMGITIY